MIEVNEYIFMPLCVLSMIPQVREHCTEDILTVLTEVRKDLDPKFGGSTNMDEFNPSLYTLFKMLDDGPVREKVEEIVKILCPHDIILVRMFLGDDHPIVLSTEKTFTDKERSNIETVLNFQADCHHKIYSIGSRYISRSDPGFIHMHFNTTLSAIIEQDIILKWEGTMPTKGKEIYISNDPSPHPKQVRLFIISQLPTPKGFWQAITSCAKQSNVSRTHY